MACSTLVLLPQPRKNQYNRYIILNICYIITLPFTSGFYSFLTVETISMSLEQAPTRILGFVQQAIVLLKITYFFIFVISVGAYLLSVRVSTK